MSRREFIALAGSIAAWPFAARAQQSGRPVLGVLNAASPDTAVYVTGLVEGLRAAGYVKGESLEIDSKWAGGHYERLPKLAAEAVIAVGGISGAIAAKGAMPASLLARADEVIE